ncbi:MAG: DUF3017 domain-containing protein [Aeriscardovia sp.]|nr:DUF3017 domain-containing protein [Aeriscardovia sp.]
MKRRRQAPLASEANEGRPWFEWIIAGLVAIAAVIACCGEILAATIILAVSAVGSATVRLVLRERSPWKVRSPLFDCVAGYVLGFGIVLAYLAVLYLA